MKGIRTPNTTLLNRRVEIRIPAADLIEDIRQLVEKRQAEEAGE